MKIEDRILRAKKNLYTKSPFYSYLVMGLTCHRHKSKSCPTFAVNQYGHLYYNPEFAQTLTDDELMGVLCHETSHVATLTFQREKGREHELWNIATDAVINYILLEENFALPNGCIIPKNGVLKIENYNIQVAGKTAEEVYDQLIQARKDYQSKGGGKGKSKSGKKGRGQGGGGGGGSWSDDDEESGGDFTNLPSGLDKHLDDDFDPDGNHSEGRESGDGDGDNDKGGAGSSSKDKDEKDKTNGQSSEGEEKEEDNPKNDMSKGPSSAQKRKNETKWRSVMSSAVVANKGRSSKITAYYEREFAKISESKISWRSVLQKFLTSSLPCDYSMRKPGRRSQGCGIYMPYVVKSGLDVNVGIDMSGSISQAEYDAFMSEIVGITNGFPQINMTIIPWASEVEEKDIRSFSRADLDEVKNWRSTLTGGTDLSCFTEYMESHPTAFSTFNPTSVNIILTDGFVEEDPKLPARNTLVVLTNPANKSIFEKKNCEVIVMDDIN